jgi:hypothetical protein
MQAAGVVVRLVLQGELEQDQVAQVVVVQAHLVLAWVLLVLTTPAAVAEVVSDPPLMQVERGVLVLLSLLTQALRLRCHQLAAG